MILLILQLSDSITAAQRITFEFGGHANLAGLTLLDVGPTLNGDRYLLGRFLTKI